MMQSAMEIDQQVQEINKEEVKNVVKQLSAQAMEVGETWYLVSSRWWVKLEDYINDDLSDLAPGPIDNTVLLKDRSATLANGKYKLEDHLAQHDYNIVPAPLWEKLQSWFSGGPSLPVPIIEEGVLKRKKAEVYPLQLKIIHNAKPLQPRKFNFSKKTTVGAFKEKVCRKLKINPEKVTIYNYMLSMRHDELKDADKTLNDYNIQMGQEIMFLEEGVADPFKEKAKGVPSMFSLGKRRMDYDPISDSPFSKKSDEHHYGKPAPPGLCGLHNLGNTCFMNSALQCLNNTPALTDHFLAGRYRKEINRTNPLGMKGKIAEAFGDLVTHLWAGEASSFMPRAFKHTLSDFAPQFSGYAQHDSQELLAFLLDGLHEDLNRVQDKPYVETKEADDREDEVVAAEFWENHKRRNDSIIVDLFQGQFKSTLVCPDCSKVSITFDPFMYLSLPLPGLLTKTIKVTLFRRDADWPVRYGVEVNKIATIRSVKETLAELSGVDPNALLVVEIFKARLHKIFQDKEKVEFINPEVDQILAYEMAEPLPGETFPDKILVPVFFSVSRVKKVKGFLEGKRSRSLQQIPSGYPLMLSLSRSGVTYKKLRSKLWKSLKFYLRKDITEAEENGDSGNSSSSSEEVDELPEKYVRLFSIKLADTNGQKVLEDLIDSGDDLPITISAKNSILVVWDAMANEVLEPNEPEPHVHESLKEKEEQKGLVLADCLQQFLTKEKLSADDPWYCPVCKEFVRATKKFDLWKLPDLLVVHLKRFSYSRIWRNKLGSYVDFPLEGLDLSEWTLRPQEGGAIYDLYAVSNHYGDLGGGHYTAFAKNKNDGKWYEYDDHRVSPVEPSAVKTKAAYVLFYKRRKV